MKRHRPEVGGLLLSLIHLAFLHLLFGGQRITWFSSPGTRKHLHDVFPYGGTVLKPMSRAASDKPNIRDLWMDINQEITVRSVFILTHPSLENRRVCERRHTPTEVFPNCRKSFSANDALPCVRIEAWSVGIDG